MKAPVVIARDIADLHLIALNQSFLSSLGARFLTSLYLAMLEDSKTLVYYEYDDDGLAGFVTGGFGLGGIYIGLIKQPIQLLQNLSPVLLSYRLLSGIIEIILFSAKQSLHRCAAKSSELPMAELYSIAVANRARGTNVSKRLYSMLSEEFLAQGTTSFKISVGDELVGAHHFYKKMGAQVIAKTHVHAASKASLYIQQI